jgi:hypothetical protein
LYLSLRGKTDWMNHAVQMAPRQRTFGFLWALGGGLTIHVEF